MLPDILLEVRKVIMFGHRGYIWPDGPNTDNKRFRCVCCDRPLEIDLNDWLISKLAGDYLLDYIEWREPVDSRYRADVQPLNYELDGDE